MLLADEATCMIFPSLEQMAKTSHSLHHQNSNSLRLQFGITWEAARLLSNVKHVLNFLVSPIMELIPEDCCQTTYGKWMLLIFLNLINKNLFMLLLTPSLAFYMPKRDQSWVFIGKTDAEAETPILCPPDTKSWLIGKDPDSGKIEGWRRSGQQRM